MTAASASPATPAATSAVRQSHRLARNSTKTGAAAKPSEPASEWTLNARPSLRSSTEDDNSAKSAGWNTALPAPATIIAAMIAQNDPAKPTAAIAAALTASPAISTPRAPIRSTRKPIGVCNTAVAML